MHRSRFPFRYLVSALICFSLTVPLFADEAFDKLIESKNYTEALSYADKKIPTANRDASVWVKLGVANLELNLTEKALACYLVASRMDAKSYAAWLGSAKVYNSLNQPANAATSAKKALDLNFTPEASWEFARSCIALNKPAEAKKALEKVVEADPANASAVRELGIIYFNEKNYPKAIDLLKASYAKQPDGALALKIGVAFKETNSLDSALAYFKIAKSKAPNAAEASFECAKIYFNTKQYEKVDPEFEDASGKVQLAAMDYWAWGTALSKSNGSPDKIARIFQLALDKFGPARSKEALETHAAVGAYYLDKKNYQSALTQYQAVSAADNAEKLVPDINFSLALCYQGLDQLKKATAHLERELVVNPGNVGAYAMLGDVYEKSRMTDKAKAVYEKMLTLNPNNPKIQMALGDYYLKSRKYQEALKYYQKRHAGAQRRCCTGHGHGGIFT
jgi:tetratricopeptide (TPR) repeat protein